MKEIEKTCATCRWEDIHPTEGPCVTCNAKYNHWQPKDGGDDE